MNFGNGEKIILDEEILNDKNTDYSYRYYLKWRIMPTIQKLIGDREKLTVTTCCLCNKEFSETDKKVIDHNHFSGQYLGIAHNKCNRLRKTKPDMVVVFHNANYDFIQLLPKSFKDYGVEVIPDGIPKAGERFMLLFLGLKLAKEVRQTKSEAKKKVEDFIFKIRFIDSLSFLGALLEKVMETFPKEKLLNLKKEFLNKEDFETVKKKLPFPYGYMNDN